MSNEDGRYSGYAIVKIFLAETNDLHISEDDFGEISKCREILNGAANIEEKYFCVSESYRDFQKAVLDVDLDSMLYSPFSGSEFYLAKANIGRYLNTFLSMVELFFDCTKGQISRATGKAITKTHISRLIDRQKTASEVFNLFYEIRNYSQHRDLAIHALKTNVKWDESKDIVSYSSSLLFRYKYVAEDGRFDKRAKEYLRQQTSGFDLRNGLKQYFSEVAELHQEIRQLLDAHVGVAEVTLREWSEKWSLQNPGVTDIGVAAVKLVDGQESASVKEAYLKIDQDQYLTLLRGRTRHHLNMRKRTILP
jgi:hypothetical protein